MTAQVSVRNQPKKIHKVSLLGHNGNVKSTKDKKCHKTLRRNVIIENKELQENQFTNIDIPILILLSDVDYITFKADKINYEFQRVNVMSREISKARSI